jgi:hypothetical protein
LGLCVANGWLASVLANAEPARIAEVEAFATVALRGRPDFWEVREVVLLLIRPSR